MNTAQPVPPAPPDPAGTSTKPSALLETLLKEPARLVHSLTHARGNVVIGWLIGFAALGMSVYGIIVGTLSGGEQLFVAPLKIALGTLGAMLICLPSLFIFACLSGIQAPLRTIVGTLCAAVCLTALLLVGFAPVAWIFSQSTDSIPFMGALHLSFWAISVAFGLRLIGALGFYGKASNYGHLRIWSAIFIFVCLQMTTALRPIIGTSQRFLPGEKKFFLAHWVETVFGVGERVNR